MNLNILAFAVPLFLILMGIEFGISKIQKSAYFKFNNSIANISIGICERMTEIFVAGTFYYIYDYVQKHYGLFKIKPGLVWWILLLFLTDFVWYWYHRFAHEINIFWAAHVVHHQSDDFNYTVSARITVFQSFIRMGFWIILPILGFPAWMITSILVVHGVYPFFTHTRLIGKLGILEYILVTPSHHRVHHASNEKYLDKNYGDMFIIWDKLFGTFQKEGDEEITFGLTKPLDSHSFLWQHFHFLAEMLLALKNERGWKNKLALVFGRPDRIYPGYREQAESLFRIKKSKSVQSVKINRYVIWQIALTCCSVFFLILFEQYVPLYQQILVALIILITLINIGAILEQKKWIFYLEVARAIVFTISIGFLYPGQYVFTTLAILPFILLAYYTPAKSTYLKLVYKNVTA